MTWQEKEKQRYEDELRARWTVLGKLIADPSNMYVLTARDGKQVSEPFDITQAIPIPIIWNPNDCFNDLSAIIVKPVTAQR